MEKKKVIALAALAVLVVLIALVLAPALRGRSEEADQQNRYAPIPEAEVVELRDHKTDTYIPKTDSDLFDYDDPYAKIGRSTTRAGGRSTFPASEDLQSAEPEDESAPKLVSPSELRSELHSDQAPAAQSKPRGTSSRSRSSHNSTAAVIGHREKAGGAPRGAEPLTSDPDPIATEDPGALENASLVASEAAPAPQVGISTRSTIFTKSGVVSSLTRESASAGESHSSTTDKRSLLDESSSVRCQFSRSGKLRAGQRVSIRTLEDMVADGCLVPKNTDLSALVRFTNRLELDITGYVLDGVLHSIDFCAYDNDGLQGLYSSEVSKALETAQQQAISTAASQLRSGVGRIAGDIIAAGSNIASSVRSDLSVTVPSGYVFYIVNNKHRHAKNN